MGMFDSLYQGTRESRGEEWQTKAYECALDRYYVGDQMPEIDKCATYQVEILGGPQPGDCDRSLATVVDGLLVDIDNERARTLPLFNYSGHLIDGERPA